MVPKKKQFLFLVDIKHLARYEFCIVFATESISVFHHTFVFKFSCRRVSSIGEEPSNNDQGNDWCKKSKVVGKGVYKKFLESIWGGANSSWYLKKWYLSNAQ